LAGEAEQELASAARTGNEHAIDRARALFESAQSTGEEAQSVASSAGSRERAGQAARALASISQQQMNAEREAAAIAASRLPTLEQQRAKQQQSLDLIQKSTKELIAS